MSKLNFNGGIIWNQNNANSVDAGVAVGMGQIIAITIRTSHVGNVLEKDTSASMCKLKLICVQAGNEHPK